MHRDIKPENILLSGDAAVVTDFGIAKALAASKIQAPGGTLTQVGTSIGTPAYMAPEQAAGDPATDHRADLCALGCIPYELLAGAPPFADRTPHQRFAAHMTEVLLGNAAAAERAMGRWEAALQHTQRARVLDPRSTGAAQQLTGILIFLRRYPEATAAADSARVLAPANLSIIHYQAMISLG